MHRDLKPGTIFLAKGRYEEFEPKLLDFGISKASGTDQLKLTTSGLLMGDARDTLFTIVGPKASNRTG